MKKTITVLLTLIVVAGLIAIAQVNDLISFDTGDKKQAYQNKGKLDVVCDLDVSKPGDSLVPPFDTVRMTMPAQFDFE